MAFLRTEEFEITASVLIDGKFAKDGRIRRKRVLGRRLKFLSGESPCADMVGVNSALGKYLAVPNFDERLARVRIDER